MASLPRLLLALGIYSAFSLPLTVQADKIDDECQQLIQADREIQEFDDDVEVFKFLQQQDRVFSNYEEAKSLEATTKELIELRESPEGQYYQQDCLGLDDSIVALENPYLNEPCAKYYEKDKKIWLKREKLLEKVKTRVKTAIDSNSDYVGLGKGGVPLATNLTEFNKALETYKNRIKNNEIRAESLRAWRDAKLASDRKLYTRCASY